MVDQRQVHGIAARRAAPGVCAERLGEALGKRLSWDDAVAAGMAVGPRPGCELVAHRVVLPMTVYPVVADPLEALGQDVLHHASEEPEDRERLVLDRLGAMVAVPGGDGVPIVALDPAVTFQDHDPRGFHQS